MCLLPDVEVSQSVTKSIAILSNGLSGISFICSLMEIHLQNGSVLCICSKASRCSAVSGCGIVVGS